MVDDDPGKLLTYEAVLSDLGENLISATSGSEALEILLKNEIAVILMDVSMPELTGFELAEMIHQHPRYQKTAIIFISAVHMTDLDRIKGYQRGAMDYISVPVVPELLRAKVSLFADLFRKSRELELLNNELEQRVQARTKELHRSSKQIRELNSQLQQRVAELESIMTVLPVGVSVAHDPQCRRITGNAALNRLLGISQEQEALVGMRRARKPASNIYHNGKRMRSSELPLQRAVATGEPVGSFELELHKPDGKVVWALASANPLFDDQGNVRGAVEALIDISEREQMQAVLRERAQLMDLATDAIVVREMSGTVKYWNAGAAALYGWTAEEAIGKNLHELLQTKFPVPHADAEIVATLTEGRRWEGTLVQTTKDNHEVIVNCRKSLQQEGNGTGTILEICYDITAKLHAEEVLRKTEKLAAMGKMAGIVAHEINNPLNAISNIFYLLRQHASLDDEARTYASWAEQELARVTQITKQTLSFYRESARPEPVSIPALLDDILSIQGRRFMTDKIAVERSYQGEGTVQAFPGELKQVFLNLIGNAIEAMPDGGRLRVRVLDSPRGNGKSRGVSVFISDTGIGISPEDGAKLFEPFFSTKSTKGTGLGLWISKGIVQKHEGTIRFRSVKLKEGRVTCFSIFIPTSFAAAQDAQPDEDQDRMHDMANGAMPLGTTA